MCHRLKFKQSNAIVIFPKGALSQTNFIKFGSAKGDTPLPRKSKDFKRQKYNGDLSLFSEKYQQK